MPQGPNLTPIAFLLNVNDVPDWPSSYMNMFAYNTEIVKQIISAD